MEKSCFPEADSCSDGRGITREDSLPSSKYPSESIRRRMGTIHILAPHFSKRYFNIFSFHLCLGLTSGLFPSGFPTDVLYEFLSSIEMFPLLKLP
jgi:hypothetical protein